MGKRRTEARREARQHQGAERRSKPGTKVLVLVILGVAVTAALIGKSPRRTASLGIARQASDATAVHDEPIPPTYSASVPGIPRLAAVGAGECIPCKAMAPIRAELRREYAGVLAVDFYDVWKDPDAAQHFRIRTIPTLIYYDASGRELGRQEGFVPKATILATLERLGIRLAARGGP